MRIRRILAAVIATAALAGVGLTGAATATATTTTATTATPASLTPGVSSQRLILVVEIQWLVVGVRRPSKAIWKAL
ncbi:hypothetical protein, partial [Streptomyces griseofuscus]|uniref:hypothetical protein n=1 Tax=Streptomyces griseofuscus TaxID=146922 RepID=UPI0034570D0C